MPRGGGDHTYERSVRPSLHLVDLDVLDPRRFRRASGRRRALELLGRYHQTVRVEDQDDAALLGFDVEVVADGSVDEPAGFYWLTTGKSFTPAECARHYERVVVASADPALVPTMAALRTHGARVVVVTARPRRGASLLAAAADEVLVLRSPRGSRRP